MKKNIESLKQALEDGLIVYGDVKQALEDDGKISFIEGSGLVLKHGGKAVRLIGSIKEIGDEIKDLDGDEAAEITSLLVDAFGGSEAAKEAIADIAVGAGRLNQGIQKLIKLKSE